MLGVMVVRVLQMLRLLIVHVVRVRRPNHVLVVREGLLILVLLARDCTVLPLVVLECVPDALATSAEENNKNTLVN